MTFLASHIPAPVLIGLAAWGALLLAFVLLVVGAAVVRDLRDWRDERRRPLAPVIELDARRPKSGRLAS